MDTCVQIVKVRLCPLKTCCFGPRPDFSGSFFWASISGLDRSGPGLNWPSPALENRPSLDDFDSGLVLKINAQKSEKIFLRNICKHYIVSFESQATLPVTRAERASLKVQILAYMEREPTAELREIRNWW